MSDWNETQPIYLQIRELILKRILSGDISEGEAIPSVRQVAAAERINPLTVSRAFQLLVDEGLIEKRRGLGMFVSEGARARGLERERNRFLTQEWPETVRRMRSLNLDVADLLQPEQNR
ncbi:MAG: GntR family transcriptional regulator [Proteobacteria bacterium]|nr:GntR family transcriptional regulator [Pseudomonadota bacterium]